MAKTAAALIPGAVLKDLLGKYNISVAKISGDIGLSPSAVRQLINNKLKISIIIALKLAKYFGKKPEYWINLQNNYEFSLLQKDAAVVAEVKKISEAKKQPAEKKAAAAKTAAKGPGRGRKAKAADTKAAAKPKGRPGRKPAAGKAAANKPAAEKKPRKPRTVKPKAAPAPAPAPEIVSE